MTRSAHDVDKHRFVPKFINANSLWFGTSKENREEVLCKTAQHMNISKGGPNR